MNGDKSNELNKIVLAALQALSPEEALNLVLPLLRDDKGAKQIENKEKIDLPVSFS